MARGIAAGLKTTLQGQSLQNATCCVNIRSSAAKNVDSGQTAAVQCPIRSLRIKKRNPHVGYVPRRGYTCLRHRYRRIVKDIPGERATQRKTIASQQYATEANAATASGMRHCSKAEILRTLLSHAQPHHICICRIQPVSAVYLVLLTIAHKAEIISQIRYSTRPSPA